MTEKVCKACGISKDINEFRYKHHVRMKCGFYVLVQCKACERQASISSGKRYVIGDVSEKPCKKCNIIKPISEFRHKKDPRYKSGVSIQSRCILCEAEDSKINGKKRYKEKGIKEFKDIYSDPILKAEWLAKNKEYRQKNKEKLKEYRAKRKDKDREIVRIWSSKKLKDNIFYRLRHRVSSSVKATIKRQGKSKNGSVLKFLPYKIKDLKEHLEYKFESWMNWSNHGKYNVKTWKDDDQSTWTWQIDHIIPHSDLPYDSMEHENFKKCWCLENLRPLSAKQNLIDGTRRTRHEVNKVNL
jgi:hypothetical protein